MTINKYVKWGTGALTGLALLIQACGSPDIEKKDTNYNPDVYSDRVDNHDFYRPDSDDFLDVRLDEESSSDGDLDSSDVEFSDSVDFGYEVDSGDFYEISEDGNGEDSFDLDVGYDGNNDLEGEVDSYEVSYDAGEDSSETGCDGNCPPVVNAGPDLELEVNIPYCFNFNCTTFELNTSCGNAPFAPGHSEKGFPNYDPDGEVVKTKIWQDYEGWPDFYNVAYPCDLISYEEIGNYILRYEMIDNEGASSYDEANINVTEKRN